MSRRPMISALTAAGAWAASPPPALSAAAVAPIIMRVLVTTEAYCFDVGAIRSASGRLALVS